MLREGTRGNRNFTHALCICWWQIRMAGKLVPGGHPRCASGTDGLSPHLRSSNRATSYLGGWWETHILALGSEMSVIYRSKWKLELWPRILPSGAPLPIPWQQEPRVTRDRLKVKCSWDSRLIKESASFKEWAECCQWRHRILPGTVFNLYTYDLWTCNNYQITYRRPLLETDDQANGLHIGFVIPLVEKNKGCDKNAALVAEPPFVPSNCWCVRGIACLSNPHWNSQALGLSGGVKPRAAIHSASPPWTWAANGTSYLRIPTQRAVQHGCPFFLSLSAETPSYSPALDRGLLHTCSLAKWADTYEHWTLEFINPSNPNEGPDPCIHEIVQNFS